MCQYSRESLLLCLFIRSGTLCFFFFFSSRRRHTRSDRDWSSDVCSSDLRGDIFWQDGVQVTASDVKFSYEGFNATAGIASGGTQNTVDVVFDPTVLPTSLGGTEAPGQPENLYVALKSASAFSLLDLTGVPIVPQHI